MIHLKKFFLRLFVLAAATIISALQTFAQVQSAPGGIRGASLWSANGDSSDFVANYRSLNLLHLKGQADTLIPPLQGATTLFLVLKPNFNTPSGSAFFELGDIRVYDNLLAHGKDSTALDFSDGHPKILTLTMQRSPRFKTISTPIFNLLDSTLFSVAELIYYPRLNDREAVKKVNSYLALKYSVPITGVTDPNWRDYWAADSSRYWDFKTDKMYDLRVLGLGRSSNEDFYQSQTMASHGSYIRLSLNGAVPQGGMPNVSIHDGAFLIMSERVPESMSTYLPCLRDGSNPLGNWKLKPMNWASAALNLYVSVDPPTKGSISDSVWLTDGSNYIWVPKISSAPKVTFKVPLASIQNGMHYFFTDVKGDPCDEITITTVANELTVDNSGGLVGLKIKYLHLNTGLTVEQPLSGRTFSTFMDKGQYQLWLLDKEGHVVSERIIQVDESAARTPMAKLPTLELIPNPVLVGKVSRLVISGLPSSHPIAIQMHDGSGKLEMKQVLDCKDQMSVELMGTSPGLHTVTVIQNGIIYSQKLLVAGH
jgi:hypothetical protein